jgi:hypothetical protein
LNFFRCPKCGSVDLKDDIYSVDIEVEGKGKYPDNLLCGHYPFQIVSENVVDKWEKASIKGFKAHKIKLFRDNEEIDKKYYNIQITSEAELDLDKMGIRVTKLCSICGKTWFNKDSWEFGKAYIKEGSWDGAGLFNLKFFKRVTLCTKDVLKIVHENKLSNFKFQKGEDRFNYFAPDIDLKKMFKE